jgi:hypothetical protein
MPNAALHTKPTLLNNVVPWGKNALSWSSTKLCDKLTAPAVKVTIIMSSVCLRLCIQGESADLNLYLVLEIIYWNGALWITINSINSVEDRAERTGIWGWQHPRQGFHPICKWMKPVFWLCCYGCIFHETGNSAHLYWNFGISSGAPPPQYATACLLVLESLPP